MCARYRRSRSCWRTGRNRVERKIVAAVEDLLFKSKILETADTLGVEAKFPRSPAKLLDALRDSPPDLLLLDLNSGRFDPLELLKTMNADAHLKSIPTVGFLSHVQADLALAAREAGCRRIMARSAFTRDLPKILSGDTKDGNGLGR